MKLQCQYEEVLDQPETIPRWFEAGNGQTLYHIIRDPVNYYQYTGRKETIPGKGDNGGQNFIKMINNFDSFIPVKVDRKAADGIVDGCSSSCMPRKLTFEISYYQLDKSTKRIVESSIRFDEFDKNVTRHDYELSFKFYPLDYQQLIVKFAYSRGIFLFIFGLIGCFTVLLSILYWIVVRVTTQIETPPSVHLFKMFQLIFPPAILGFTYGEQILNTASS